MKNENILEYLNENRDILTFVYCVLTYEESETRSLILIFYQIIHPYRLVYDTVH